MGEAVGAHAIDAAAEHRVLDGGVARDHHGLHAALARVIGQLLNHLVSRLPRRREDHLDAADLRATALGQLVVGGVEDDDGAHVAPGIVHHVVDKPVAGGVEEIIGVVLIGPRLPPIPAARPQHVVPVNDEELFPLLGHDAICGLFPVLAQPLVHAGGGGLGHIQ